MICHLRFLSSDAIPAFNAIRHNVQSFLQTMQHASCPPSANLCLNSSALTIPVRMTRRTWLPTWICRTMASDARFCGVNYIAAFIANYTQSFTHDTTPFCRDQHVQAGRVTSFSLMRFAFLRFATSASIVSLPTTINLCFQNVRYLRVTASVETSPHVLQIMIAQLSKDTATKLP